MKSKKSFGTVSKGFSYACFFQDLIQHHSRWARKSLYFEPEFIYDGVAGKKLGVVMNEYEWSSQSDGSTG